MNDEPTRILVVDDELGMREGCRKVLTEEGYEVETAEDGAAGLELFKKRNNFAAAIIDIKMPKMDGLELIKKIHEHDRDAVLLVITAYSTIESAVEATKRGAYGYIPKPFTPDELLIPVKNGLEKRSLTIEARRLTEEREKRLLELALERSKCSTIIRCMTDGVVVINRDKQIVLYNAAAARIIPEFDSLPLPSPLSVFESTEIRESINETVEPASPPSILSREIVLGRCTYMVNISPIFELNGEFSGAIMVLRDITALKKLETAKSMFVSMVAHEIKNPLAAVESYLDLILHGLTKGDPEKELHMIGRSLMRIRTLRKMVVELMNLTAMETGNFVIKRSPVDICEVTAHAVESFRDQVEEKNITLRLDCKRVEKMVKVLADRDTMSIVFTNLIDNAIKYTPRNGHINIFVEQNGIYARVKVKDDGVGMTAQEKEKIFDEFFRAKNRYTANIPGTGLGLSLVKRILEMHQGKIELETAPQKGSVFTVSIPLFS